MNDRWRIDCGNCLDLLAAMPEQSVDACVTDPPYELGFMGKRWDKSGIAFSPDTWRAVFRVLKPGAHLLAFGGTRTVHRIALAVEDAGFEIRDQIAWMYASGFPKSLNISKAIDSAAGAERVETRKWSSISDSVNTESHRGTQICATCGKHVGSQAANCKCPPSAPATEAAKQWDGWGTALKPAMEPVIVARKPLNGTVVANVLKHGTGGINVDGCRIAGEVPSTVQGQSSRQGEVYGADQRNLRRFDGSPLGRWPANVILDAEAGALLDEMSGNRPGVSGGGKHADGYAGGISRMFYCPKADRSERDAGLESFPEITAGEATDRADDTDGLNSPRAGAGRTGGARNSHPTVKPIDLMRYLCRLVTPPGGLVLDPFTGSGTTGIAAVLEGFRFTGCELDPYHCDIASARIAHYIGGGWEARTEKAKSVQPKQASLFERTGTE